MSSTSTLLNVTLFCDVVRSVRSFKKSLSILTPSFVSRLHLSVRSVSSFSPFMSVVLTLILSELRSLQIVEVDSLLRPLNNCFSNNLLISVDFPALVSPEIYSYILIFWNKVEGNHKLYMIPFSFLLPHIVLPAITIPWSEFSRSFIHFRRTVRQSGIDSSSSLRRSCVHSLLRIKLSQSLYKDNTFFSTASLSSRLDFLRKKYDNTSLLKLNNL